jgi:pimeloyl-ACP methyl ester carboxylesterase
MAILYAVSHPDRARALVLYNTAARYPVADDFPIGYFQEVDGVIELVRTLWGRPEFVAINSPGIAKNEGRLDALARLYRSSATPRASAAARLHIEERRRAPCPAAYSDPHPRSPRA